MKALRSSLLFSTAVILLLMIGCTDQPPTAPAANEGVTLVQESDFISARQFFTGRDSFGVALKADFSTTKETAITGTSAGADECPGTPDVAFEGTGTATHLGRVHITHSHTVNDAGSEAAAWCGTFTMTGTTGGELVGRYEGLLQDGVFEGRAWVTGGDVQATPVASEEGRASMSGTLDGDSFHFEVDGWLFHHLRKS